MKVSRVFWSIALGLVTTIVFAIALVYGWIFGAFLFDWAIGLGPVIIVGGMIFGLFLFLANWFYEHVFR